MLACATFPSIQPASAAPRLSPVIFIDGQPVPELSVISLEQKWPLAIRETRVVAATDNASKDWLGQTASIAVPRLLADGQTRWQVLTHGQLASARKSQAVGEDHKTLVLIDRWETTLSTSPDLDLALGQTPSTDTTIRLGDSANRSAQRHLVHGQLVYVPQRDGQPWTLGEALETLSAVHQLDLSIQVLPTAVHDQPLRETVSLAEPARQQLSTLLADERLVVHRQFSTTLDAPRETRALRLLQHGRCITLPLNNNGHSYDPQIEFHRQINTTSARQWIAQGERPVVESTFTLQPGWDPQLEGEGDSTYDQAANPLFSRYANVYRLWLLNEDQRLSGPAYDLAALFDQPELKPTPIAFSQPLTLDENGRRLQPIVEFSLDSGTTWSRFNQDYRLLRDAAGVYLDPVTIEGATLAAAKAGTLSIRVTASLVSPRPAESKRWRGNPFDSTQPPLRFDLGQQFLFRRVTAESIHHPEIQNGLLAADQHDDTNELAGWLVQRMDQADKIDTQNQGDSTVKLHHARPELEAGDRIDRLLFESHHADGRCASQRFSASITETRCDFLADTTTLSLRF